MVGGPRGRQANDTALGGEEASGPSTAAEMHDSGEAETAGHHAHLAAGHTHHAVHHAAEAAKSHVEHHSTKG